VALKFGTGRREYSKSAIVERAVKAVWPIEICVLKTTVTMLLAGIL
jgi:hypothetical protein